MENLSSGYVYTVEPISRLDSAKITPNDGAALAYSSYFVITARPNSRLALDFSISPIALSSGRDTLRCSFNSRSAYILEDHSYIDPRITNIITVGPESVATVVVGLVVDVPKLAAANDYYTTIELKATDISTGLSVTDSALFVISILYFYDPSPGDLAVCGLSPGQTYLVSADPDVAGAISPVISGKEIVCSHTFTYVIGDPDAHIRVSFVLPKRIYSSGYIRDSISCSFPDNSAFWGEGHMLFDPKTPTNLTLDHNGKATFSIGISVTIPRRIANDDYVGEALITAQYTGLKNNFGKRLIPNQIPQPIPITITPDNSPLPQSYSLRQNFPNPFNPTTKIRYELPEDANTTVKIFDLLGQEVETIVDGLQTKGFHETIWQPNNKQSGVYYYRIHANNFTATKKMLLIK